MISDVFIEILIGESIHLLLLCKFLIAKLAFMSFFRSKRMAKLATKAFPSVVETIVIITTVEKWVQESQRSLQHTPMEN